MAKEQAQWVIYQRLILSYSLPFPNPVTSGNFSNPWLKVKVKSLSRAPLFATPQTVAHQAPPSMEFSRQEDWSGLPFPSPGDLPGD